MTDKKLKKTTTVHEHSMHVPVSRKKPTGITTSTLKILQDPNGEAKDFLFKDIRQKDLYDPEIAIPLATRWLFRKKATATNRLGRSPTTEELILEYKGLLPSKTKFHDNALQKFKFIYEKLKKL